MRHTTTITRLALHAATLAAAFTVLSCDGSEGMLPHSGGAPSEVLVTGQGCECIVSTLGADVPGLPQPEPMFDVKALTDNTLDATAHLERNIVVTDIDSLRHSATTVRYERNVYARPQIIIYVSSPSEQTLRRDIGRCHIDRLLLRNELAHYAARLTSDTCSTAKEIRKTFGCSMRLPKDVTIRKRGKNFIWLSDNNPLKSGNICIYTSENRDSVMQRNIKGETDNTHMTTVAGSVVDVCQISDRCKVTTKRGLWQMTGDAMGGPFVSRTITLPSGQTIVGEAFVFAPGERKRDKIRQLEASLMTMKADAEGCKDK